MGMTIVFDGGFSIVVQRIHESIFRVDRILLHLGGQTITLGGPFILHKSIRDAHYRMIGGYMNDLAEEFITRGLKTVFHPHLTTLAQNSEEIDRLYESADKNLIGLLLARRIFWP